MNTQNSDCINREHVLLRERDVADRWHRSLRTLQRWRKLGYGPAFMRVGGSIYYRMADVLAFEAARTRPGDAP